MRSKDDWNENCAVYQSLFENTKLFVLKTQIFQIHQNFSTFIDMNPGWSV